MGVSRAGYYKWKKRGKPAYQDKREQVIALVTKIHTEHPSHGYRWVAAFIQINEGVSFSDNYVYKAFRFLGFQSETKHKEHSRPRKVKDKYPNLIYKTWDTVDRPRQVIVSDMTQFYVKGTVYELTLYFDAWNKEILGYGLGTRKGDTRSYYNGLKQVLERIKKEQPEDLITLHTDQGSVYSSKAYNDLIKDFNIQRSMSRAGTPTDNPVNESLNGWIKEELFIDFHLDESDDVPGDIEKYIYYYNNERPSYSLNYKTPLQFKTEMGF